MRLTLLQRRGLIFAFSLAAAGFVLFQVPWNSKPSAGALEIPDNSSLRPTPEGNRTPPLHTAPSAATPKSVIEMTVEERNRFAGELKGLSTQALADRLFHLLQTKGDSGEIDLAWRLLVPKLQTDLEEGEKAQIYSQIRSLLVGSELADNQKLELIQMLGSTATPEALGLLLQLTEQNRVLNLRQVVHNMIGGIGEVQWGGQFHPELSSLLEQAWKTSGAVPGFREALAEAIAGVGARSGIELLYEEARRGGQTIAEFSVQEDNMAWQVLDVFQKIRNPDAVPVLAARLGDQALDNFDLVLSGTSLAAMGRPEATSALLHWAESSKRDVGQLIEPWLSEVRDPDSFTLLEQKIAEPTRFNNQDNWKALDRALREWHSRRDTTTSEN